MLSAQTSWLSLTPEGAFKAFAQNQPEAVDLALQALLGQELTLECAAWETLHPHLPSITELALQNGWVERLPRPLQGPDARLDDFLQHVIASLSGERRAVLASDSGFCLGFAGVEQDQADSMSVAAADFSEFAARQTRRGWVGANRYVSFHSDSAMLLPSYSFLPFWVDGVGYWLIIMGEPLLNNQALVELLWGIKLAGTRFNTP
jgi:hypothetical protein